MFYFANIINITVQICAQQYMPVQSIVTTPGNAEDLLLCIVRKHKTNTNQPQLGCQNLYVSSVRLDGKVLFCIEISTGNPGKRYTDETRREAMNGAHKLSLQLTLN